MDPVGLAVTAVFGPSDPGRGASVGELDLRDVAGQDDYASIGLAYAWLADDGAGILTRECWLQAIDECVDLGDIASAFLLLSRVPVTESAFGGSSGIGGTWAGFFDEEPKRLLERIWVARFDISVYLTLDLSVPLGAEELSDLFRSAHELLLAQYEYLPLPGGSQ